MHSLLATLLPIGAPALPLDEAGKYVASAFIVFMVLLVVYVAIMAAKLQRIERELRELCRLDERDAVLGEVGLEVGFAHPGRHQPTVKIALRLRDSRKRSRH